MIINATFQMMHLKTPPSLMRRRKLARRQVKILIIMTWIMMKIKMRIMRIMMRILRRIVNHDYNEDHEDDEKGDELIAGKPPT